MMCNALILSLGISSPRRGGPSHGDRQHAQKFSKDSACGSEDMLADRHTQRERHTDVLITLLLHRYRRQSNHKVNTSNDIHITNRNKNQNY